MTTKNLKQKEDPVALRVNPVTLLVPHSRLTVSIPSFANVVKAVESMVSLQHERDQEMLRDSSPDSVSASDKSTTPTDEVGKNKQSRSKVDKKVLPATSSFSVLDLFYTFKNQVVPQSNSNFSMLKHLTACETK